MEKKQLDTNQKIVDINGTKIIYENGETRLVLSEEIQKSDFMSVEEAFKIIKEEVKMIYDQSMEDSQKRIL